MGTRVGSEYTTRISFATLTNDLPSNEEPLIPKGVKWEKWVDSFRKIVDQKEQDILRQVAERKTAMCIHISTFSSFQVALVADHRTFHSDADSKELRARLMPILASALSPAQTS